MTLNKFEYISAMKKLLLILILIALQACKEQPKTNPESAETETELSKELTELTQEETTEEPIKVKIPSYDFTAFQEKILANKNDTTYVVNFWATWCKPCVKELPYFEKVNKEMFLYMFL